MSISKQLTLLVMLAAAVSGAGQQRYDLGTFSGIRSEGPIPADLRKGLGELYGEDKQRVRDYNDGKLTNRDRVLEASYHINRLMAGGRILYGDPITRMVERIADTLLRDYPELRHELRFYTVKSLSVNAFATGQGMIFVTTGLVAQVENESQLAYVISHEIVHYYRKHNMEVLTRRIRTSDDEAEQMADFLKYHNRSREMEYEADSLGLRLFYISSAYDKRVADGIFDVLQYAMLPFDEVPFDTTYFNSPYYRLPSHYFLKEVAPILSRDDYPDSLSTHPNIKKRRARTGEILSHYEGGNTYVVTTPEEFAQLRTLARFECVRQNLIYANYTRAFYDCYVLERQYPGNAFLARSKAQALYGIAMYKTYQNTNTIVGDYHKYEGEIQQLYYLFRQLTAQEASLVAMREVWKTLQAFPGDPQLEAMGRDLLATLRSKHSLSRGSFADSYDTVSAAPDTAAMSSAVKNQKYARIRQKQQEKHIADQSRYAFTDFMMQDGQFLRFMDSCMAPATSAEAGSNVGATYLYAPQYLVVENSKEAAVKYRKSDHMEQSLVGCVREAAQAVSMPVVDFSDFAMRSHSDAGYYNDFVAINEWTNEFWQSKGNVPLSLSTQPLMNDLNRRYGADKLSLNMALNSEYNRLGSFFTLLVGAAVPPSLPLFAYEYFSNRETTLTRNLLIDTRKARVLSDQAVEHYFTDSKDLVTNDVFTTFYKASAPGRTPGFLGRRLAVTAQMGVGFPVMNWIFERFTDRKVDFRPGIALELVTGQRQSLSLNVDYNKTRFFVDDGYTLGRDRYGWLIFGELYDTRILTAALSYRFYMANSVAPLGPYIGAGLYGSSLNLNPQDEACLYNRLDTSYYRFGVQLEAGRNYMLANKVVLNIGLRYSFTIANPFHKDDFDVFIPTDEDRIRQAKLNAQRQMNADLWMAQLVILNIGIGFLPF